ncbi:MAG: AfsR/SARP family transcriptional regulator, partial [Chloroflexota bacterium]
MSDALRVVLLGGLGITCDGEPVTGFTSKKSPALLSYLITTARPHSREALSVLLWDESGEGRARASLRTVLWDLRQHLPRYVDADRKTVAFDTEAPHWFDVSEFGAGVEVLLGSGGSGEDRDLPLTEEQLRAGEKALSLYRGDFLAGFHVSEATGFESWMLRKREWARQLAVQGWHRLVIHYAAEQRYIKGIEAATQLLGIAPWQEETHRQLMRLLALNGQRGAALAQYESCCAMLDDELGVEPTIETRLLYSRIKSGKSLDMGRAAPVIVGGVHASRDAPPVLSEGAPLVGRDQDLAAVRRLLGNPDCRLAVLMGPDGVGKTSLAWEVANEVAEMFDDGVWFVQMDRQESAISTSSPALATAADAKTGMDVCCPELLFSMTRGLGVVPIDRSPLGTQLTDYLCQRELLLILDDFHVSDANMAWLNGLLQCAPSLRVLALSSQSFDGRPAPTFRLQSLEVPRTVDRGSASGHGAGRLRHGDAVTLFLQRAGQVDPGFELDRYAADCVVQACELVDGMPLAIYLIASTAGRVTPDDMVRRIERQKESPAIRALLRAGLHVGVAAAVGYAWEVLSVARRRVLLRLTYFESDFSEQAAAEVAGASSRDLDGLARTGWLLPVEVGRYALHPSLRQAVVMKSHQLGPGSDSGKGSAASSDVRVRFQDYYLGYVATRAELLVTGGAQQVRDGIEREWRNVRLAWRQAAAGDARELLGGSLLGMTRFLLSKGWLW